MKTFFAQLFSLRMMPPGRRETANAPSPRAEAFAASRLARKYTVSPFPAKAELPASPQLAAERADDPAPAVPARRILRCASR